MNESRFDNRLSGFYPPEEGRFRWTSRKFSVRFTALQAGVSGTDLIMRLYIPESVIQQLGAITMTTTFGGHSLSPETWTRSGQHVFRRELNDAWLEKEPVQIDFALNKATPTAASDRRELGIVVTEIAVEPE